MPEPRAPDREARPAGRRRKGLLVAGALVLLLLGIPLVGVYEKTSEAGPNKDPKPGGPPSVMQVHATTKTTKAARAENVQYVLSLDQEVYVDVLAPDLWLLQLLNALQKQDLDPRAKVTLDTVVFDPATEKENHARQKELLNEKKLVDAERQRVEALPNGSRERETSSAALEQRQACLIKNADTLLDGRRYFAWQRAVNKWLERSCLVVNGRVFRDLNPQVAYEWWEPDHYVTLRFKIVLTEANKQQWLELLGGIGLGNTPVAVSIAMVDLFEKDKSEIMLTAINPS